MKTTLLTDLKIRVLDDWAEMGFKVINDKPMQARCREVAQLVGRQAVRMFLGQDDLIVWFDHAHSKVWRKYAAGWSDYGLLIQEAVEAYKTYSLRGFDSEIKEAGHVRREVGIRE